MQEIDSTTISDLLVFLSSSLVAIVLFVLSQIASTRLKVIEESTNRYERLLEDCYGPLKGYFSQTKTLKESSRDMPHSVNTNSLKHYLYFRAGLLESIEMIYNKYQFELESRDLQFKENIEFMLMQASGLRSNKEELRSHNLYRIIGVVSFNKMSDRDIYHAFESWREKILDQINAIRGNLENNIVEYRKIRNSGRGIISLVYKSPKF